MKRESEKAYRRGRGRRGLFLGSGKFSRERGENDPHKTGRWVRTESEIVNVTCLIYPQGRVERDLGRGKNGEVKTVRAPGVGQGWPE